MEGMMKRKRQLYLYIPENFDVDQFIKDNPPPFKKFHRDDLVVIMSLINEVRSYNNAKYLFDDGFVALNAQKIQHKGIRNFPKYKKWLIEKGVIVCDELYIKDTKSKGYKFTEKYETKVKLETISKTGLVNSHYRLFKKSKKRNKAENEYSYLTKWINDDIKIDVNAAKKWAYQNYNADKAKGETERKALARLNAALINIDKINRGMLTSFVDDSAGRFYSNLTFIKSEIRNFITYKDQKLVALDLKNSQPFMSLLLMDSNFWKLTKTDSKGFVGGMDSWYRENIRGNGRKGKEGSSLISTMLAKRGISFDSEEFREYKNLVLGKGIYEELWEVMNDMAKGDEEIDLVRKCKNSRPLLKSQVLKAYYSQNTKLSDNSALIKRAFQKRFPEVYKLFHFIKSNNYKVFSHLLQAIECDAILKRVAGRLAREYPKMFIATIHDSVITTVGNEHIVRQVMLEELTESIGFPPVVNNEFWDSQKIDHDELDEFDKEMKLIGHYINLNGVEINIHKDGVLFTHSLSSGLYLEHLSNSVPKALKEFNVNSLDDVTGEDLLALQVP
jgi:hypothetical protein